MRTRPSMDAGDGAGAAAEADPIPWLSVPSCTWHCVPRTEADGQSKGAGCPISGMTRPSFLSIPALWFVTPFDEPGRRARDGQPRFPDIPSAPMLLFQKRFHAGLLDGSIRLTFRRWQKPHVRAGGRYRCHPIGVLEVEQVDLVPVRSISDDEARLAGFPGRDALLDFMAGGPAGPVTPGSEVWRVALHHGGDGDRVESALDEDLTPADVAALARRLDRLGEWAVPTLRLIARRPRVAASVLATSLGRERDPFKVDVRKLKRLGLTQSFEVGYELSPRGRALLARLPRRPAAPQRQARRKKAPGRRRS